MSRKSRVGKFAGTHNFWACDEQAICRRCGAEYRKTNRNQKFCGCRPTKLEITLEQSIIVHHFRNLLRKYHLSVYDTIHMITKRDPREFYALTNPRLQYKLSELKRKRYVQLIDRFNREFEQGWYDFDVVKLREPFHKFSFKHVITRRQTPLPKSCAKSLSHCPGTVLPGSCPRQWRECPLSEAASGLRCS